MGEHLDPNVQWCYDLNTVDALLSRLCESDDERAAAKRVMGVDRQERLAAEVYVPQLPPQTPFRPTVDYLAVARDALARYRAWVESYPDDDPTPLRSRERALRRARESVEQLEGRVGP